MKKGFLQDPSFLCSLHGTFFSSQDLGMGCVMLGHRGVEVSPPAGSTPAEVLAEVLNLPDGMLSVNTSPSIRDLRV